MRPPTGVAGRPRDPQVEPRVIAATLELLAVKGFAALRIDDVARASGVAKSTIYRRWPTLTHLVLDAVDAALGPRTVELTGDELHDLERLVRVVVGAFTATEVGRAVPAIGIEAMRRPELAPAYRSRFVDPLRHQAISLIERGIAQGLFRSEVDPALVVDAVTGALVLRLLVTGEPVDAEDLVALAEQLLLR